MSRALYAYNYYLKKGIPSHVAAGLVGNFKVESDNFAPDVLNGQRRGDNGTAYGLAQWRGKRLDNLNAYAKQQGTDWRNSLDTQLDFALEEFNPQSPFRDQIAANNYQRLMQTQSPEQATHLIMNKFERAHPSPQMNHIGKRVDFANKIYGTQYSPQQLANLNNIPGAPTGIDMPSGATVPPGTAQALAANQATAQQLAQVQAAKAGQQAAAQPAADPFGGLLNLMSMAKQQQQKPPQISPDAIEPQQGGNALQQDMNPQEQVAMTSHTPNVYMNRLRRNRLYG